MKNKELTEKIIGCAYRVYPEVSGWDLVSWNLLMRSVYSVSFKKRVESTTAAAHYGIL